jgi:acyl-coenzyme A synthetase/AMP-(fatty) acid ligase/thioesterase domain-containing protein/aryl carrier-like protein
MTTRPSAIAKGIVDWSARDPNRAAFVDVRHTLTVGELDRAAGALAARLLNGATAGDSFWLPVVVDRSLESTVALHGAIRAGLASTPIESHLPRELVAEMFSRLGHPRRAVIAQPEYAALLPTGVEAIHARGHESGGTAPPEPVDHYAAGVVLFTSGTTGRPKGVILPWGSLDERVERALEDGPPPEVGTWRESFVQPFGFAPAVRAIALPCVGRTLCVVDPNTMSVDELLDWLDAQQVDSVSFPPSLSTSVLRVADGRQRLPSVSLFRSGAEASDWALVAPLRTLIGPHVMIRAGYATSEAGKITRFEIGPDDPIGTGRIPMGRLEPGVEVRLEMLEDDPTLTQLLAANPRALGYLGDPELTARRFTTDEDGVRWWKSGDIVDVDDHGVYRHHGRADELVKIHGVFVAPSRLEQELRTIDGVGAAAVIATETTSGHTLLVAHVQVDDLRLKPERVEKSLRARLPRHLMPAILVRHDALPRTDRQKVDKRALARAPLVRWRSAPARVPTAPIELWCLGEIRRIVGLDDIGPDDDLFEAGLDSLSVLELCAAFADAGFGDIEPTQLIEAHTCARICATVDRTIPIDSSTIVAMNRTGTRAPLFVLPGGGGTALKFRLLAEFLGPDRPLLVIEPRGMHRPGAPDRSIVAMADHAQQEAEARLHAHEPCLMVGYSASAPIAYEVVQRMHAAGRAAHLLLLDGAPLRPRRGSKEQLLRSANDPFVPREVTIRTATRRELPGAVRRSLWYRWNLMFAMWFERVPGPPRYTEARYRAFLRILAKASHEYGPIPAEFPATLIYVGNDEVVARTQAYIPDLTVIVVGGDHHTMLQMPEVVNLASVVAAWADAVEAGVPAATS